MFFFGSLQLMAEDRRFHQLLLIYFPELQVATGLSSIQCWFKTTERNRNTRFTYSMLLQIVSSPVQEEIDAIVAQNIAHEEEEEEEACGIFIQHKILLTSKALFS